MNPIDDLIRFLELRLEEFLRAHPELELQALEEQLRQQEADTTRAIAQSRAEQQRLQDSILATAREIKRWHERVTQAEAANRPDLAQGARQREADLLSQGNQFWGQMTGVKERIQQMEKLLQQAQLRRQEVEQKLRAMQREQAERQTASASAQTFSWSGWSQPSSDWDELETKFRDLETDLELEELKRQQQNGY
ncbi:TIGR04376 family protein [Synechococcus sp. PCC 7336]|uniref:TIGR04376 family protein n=1 Tax=Synechococcus sp. PCC 7336 TaxID=195250 RepID=UPI000347D98E|nr:TIGR04376 family protein [Synechococcus sp. PCC 7336]